MADSSSPGSFPADGLALMAGTIEGLKRLFPSRFWPAVWLTGGTVRDALLGRIGRDIDLAAAVPAGLLEGLGFRHVAGRSTAPVWLRHFQELGGVEITLLESPEALGNDLARRDFTINAMALSLAGELADPLGGLGHLGMGALHPCSDHVFREDPLRLFRAFRFCAEGFYLSREICWLLEGGDWERLLQAIPVERFSREMLKALAAPRPELFFRLMLRFGAGRNFLPEVFAMPAVPAGPTRHHPEGDLFRHSCQVLAAVASATPDPLARYCAFFHDLGKLATDPLLHPSHHGHEEAGFAHALELGKRLRLPREYGRALSWVSRLHGKANKLATLRDSTGIGVAEQALKGGAESILPLVSAADSPGGMDMHLWQQLLQVVRMTVAELGIGAEGLGKIPPEKRGEFLLAKRVEALRGLPRVNSPLHSS